MRRSVSRNGRGVTEPKAKLDTGWHSGNIKLIAVRRGEDFRRIRARELLVILQRTQEEENTGSFEAVSSSLAAVSEDTEVETYEVTGDSHGIFASDAVHKAMAANSLQMPSQSDALEAHSKEPRKCKQHMDLLSSAQIASLMRDNDASDTQRVAAMSALKTSGSEVTETPSFERHYLLLDIRGEEFAQYHIRSALQYETERLKRDQIGADIYQYKGRKDKAIVVCGNDDKRVFAFANELSAKLRVENIFVLTQSVQRFCFAHSEQCVGEIPADLRRQMEAQSGMRQRTVRYDPVAIVRKTKGMTTAKRSQGKRRRHSFPRGQKLDTASLCTVHSCHSVASTRTWVP